MIKKFGAALALALCIAAASAAPVELNKGSVAELDGLPGVGPALSGRIAEARQKGEFKDWPDFMARVKGVKAKTARKLSDAGLTVNGKAYDGAATESPKTKAKAKN